MRLRPLTLLVALATAACGAVGEDSPTNDERVAVRVKRVEQRSLSRRVEVSGRLSANEAVEIRPKTSGRVIAIHRHEGDAVQAGELLLEIDPTESALQRDRAAAMVSQARARLGDTKRVLRRTKELFANGIGSESRLDEAQVRLQIHSAELETARANLSLAETRLAETRIVAPIDGVLQDRTVSVGDTVGGGSFGGSDGPESRGEEGPSMGGGGFGKAVFTLIQVDPLRLEINVAEQDVPYVRQTDTPIPVRVDVWPDREFTGFVEFIAPSLHPVAHTQMIRLRVPNEDRALKPGFFARVYSVRELAEDTLVVPADAIVTLAGATGVYVVNGEGTAHLRPVRRDFESGRFAAVLEGVAAGELVVVEGQSKIRNGTPVRVVQDDVAAGS